MNAIPEVERIRELAEIVAEPHSWLVLHEKLAQRTEEAQERQRANPKPRSKAKAMQPGRTHRPDDFGLAVQLLADAFERGNWRAHHCAEFVGLLKEGCVSPADVRFLIRVWNTRNRDTPTDSQMIPAYKEDPPTDAQTTPPPSP